MGSFYVKAATFAEQSRIKIALEQALESCLSTDILGRVATRQARSRVFQLLRDELVYRRRRRFEDGALACSRALSFRCVHSLLDGHNLSIQDLAVHDRSE